MANSENQTQPNSGDRKASDVRHISVAIVGPNHDRDTEMAKLRESGWTYRALGARYGLTKSGIEAALRRFRQPRDQQFGLSVRTFNAIRHSIGFDTGDYGPLTLRVIAAYSYRELLEMPCLGLASAREVASMLWRHGIKIDGLPVRLEMFKPGKLGFTGSLLRRPLWCDLADEYLT